MEPDSDLKLSMHWYMHSCNACLRSMHWKLCRPVCLASSHDDSLQVNGHLWRNGQAVDGITVSGAWDRQLWAGYPDGTRKLLWKASPPYQPDAL